MLVFNKKEKLQQHLSTIYVENQIGFVPTMGALHQGHLSLIAQSQLKNDITIVSIFINPTQFNNIEDLEKYPRHLESDLKQLESINCDIVFTPNANDIYNNSIIASRFNFDGLEYQMEGAFREGHFDGVGTIVKRLFEIIQPNNAYFGEKDFQQLQIIKALVKQNLFEINIQACEIYREKDGLAMSSRNTRLSSTQRKEVPLIYKTILRVKELFKAESYSNIQSWVSNQFEDNPILSLDYFEITDESTLRTIKSKEIDKKYRAFIAINVGDIRLIDNISL
jgi:pantoate--beta-alanine ligase